MSDEHTTRPAPTVTSNRQAARLACDTERARITALLAMAPEGSIPMPILQAIESGTPAAVFTTTQRKHTTPVQSAGTTLPAPAPSSGSKWSKITARFNAPSDEVAS